MINKIKTLKSRTLKQKSDFFLKILKNTYYETKIISQKNHKNKILFFNLQINKNVV